MYLFGGACFAVCCPKMVAIGNSDCQALIDKANLLRESYMEYVVMYLGLLYVVSIWKFLAKAGQQKSKHAEYAFILLIKDNYQDGFNPENLP